MRILLISGEYPPMQGGVGDYTREMARALVAGGHDVWVLVTDELREAYGPGNPLPWHVLPRIRDWKWGCWRQICSTVRDVQPDVVNIQYQAAIYDMRTPAINFLPYRLSRLPNRPPVVVTYHDLKPPYLFPKAGPLRDWVVRALARRSDAVILTNAKDDAIASTWPFTQPPNHPTTQSPTIHQIPIGSNIAVAPPADYDRATWRARFGYGPADYVWAYFGFLNESKGGETLIRALAHALRSTCNLQPATCNLLMIGGRTGTSDPTNRAYAAHVEALMDELGITDRVRWTGYVPTEEVSAALLNTDVLVLPYRDGVSFRRGSLHAALLHGCAIVSTTPQVPLPELCDGENILLVPPDDPVALSQAALRLCRDPALRERIGRGAQALAQQQFTWERIAQRTIDEVFQPLLAARASKS
jgi:glycosyltransferase involved in cell wall biosynthesis